MLLIDLLNSFSEIELNRFSRFVNAAYFNTDQYVTKLLDLLQTHIIRQTAFNTISQSKIFQQLNYKSEIVGTTLNKRQNKILHAKMSDLLKLAKKFLYIETIQELTASEKELLYRRLLDKKQYQLITRSLAKDKKLLRHITAKDIAYYNFSFQVEKAKFMQMHQTGLLLKKDNLPELTESLDLYYILNKLSLHVAALSLANASAQKEYDFSAMEAIAPLLDLPQYANQPLVKIYRCVIKLIQAGNDTIYHQLLTLLEEHASVIPQHNLNDFYIAASNFSSAQIRKGNVTYSKKLFQLYKIMDAKNLIIESGFVPIKKLKNAITLSCKVKEFEWAKMMIDKYRPAIKKGQRDSVWHFNSGLIAFYQNDFKTAISHFIRVDKINLAYDVDCKIILLKSHYEMDKDYDERTMRIFRSAAQFIKNNKLLPKAHKKGYQNLINIVISLYRFRHKAGKQSLERIRKKLEGFDMVGDKEWLLEKIQMLEP